MRFYFAGGAMEVGGSCIYLRCAEYGILFDSGIRQGAGTKDPLPDFRGIQLRGGVDAIVVSHAHMDHTGSLPVISKAYPGAKIYMTRMTMDLTRVLLADSLKLMERREEEIPQYSADDVSGMISRICPMSFQAETEILPGVRLTFYPAGHIAGAACAYVKTPEGAVFYSGDVSGFLQQTIEGISLPKLRPDVLLLESTYGDRLHASRALEEERFVRIMAECLREGKKVLIPAFALGRSQEVLLLLRSALQNGQIPSVPVYVDGMIRDMNRVYISNPTYLRRTLAKRILKGDDPFYTQEIREVGRTEDRMVLLEKQGAAVFVASSGMLMGGPSTTYAKALLGREDACILLTGYQDEESPGRMLLNLLDSKESEKKVTLDGQIIPVKCRVEMVGLSAHADSTQLQGIAQHLGSRRIVLEHGNAEAIGALGEALSQDYRCQVYQPSCGEELEIVLSKQRKQREVEMDFPWIMQRNAFDPEQDPVWLWDYCRQHYAERAFTAEQLYYIWYGKKPSAEGEPSPEINVSEESVSLLVQALLSSGRFSRHPIRLYLFRPNTEEEVDKLAKKNQPTQQDVDALLHQLTEGADVRRFSYYIEKKLAVVNFDFPDAVPKERTEEWGEELYAKTGWRLEQKETMNHQAAGALLQELFGSRIKKISFYEEKKRYWISLSYVEPGDRKKAEVFAGKTGWKLEGVEEEATENIQEPSGEQNVSSSLNGWTTWQEKVLNGWFLPSPSSQKTEQNLAFSLIDAAFSESAIRPYKKGRKNDSFGVYLELSFLSPELGLRCGEMLKELAEQIGWRLHVSESVNQNALFFTAAKLCSQFNVPVLKNPAYHPGNKTVKIVCPPGVQVPEELKTQFLEETGLVLQAD